MADKDPVSTGVDQLESIFALQEKLNDYVFSKNHITGIDGQPLTMASIRQAVADGKMSVNDLPNQWLVNYAKAMKSELAELDDDLLWKWWSKDRIDLQNIRVELVDILHFLVSAMICAGLTPERLHDIYVQKHNVNIQRQDSGYGKDTKDEADNRSID